MPYPVREGGNSSQGVPLYYLLRSVVMLWAVIAPPFDLTFNGRHRYSFDPKWGEGTTLSYIGPGMAFYGGHKTISANPTNITRVSV